ncbi:MAG: hypothetical protein ACOZAL_00960 [Patescibacteria group bacterium]
MTVISLAHSNIVRSQISNWKEGSSKIKTKKLLVLVLIFSILMIGLFYIIQANTITNNGYKIRALKKDSTQLEERNKNLQISISNLKSISVLESKTESFGMIKAQNVEYLAIPLANVAAAR